MKKKVISLFALFLLSGASMNAQYSSEEEAVELTNKLRNLPNIEVGKGVSFMPKDSLFKLNIRFRMQNMVGVSLDDNFEVEETDLMVKRLRLRFDGYMFSPKLTYSIQLGFTPYDTKPGSSGNTNIIRDAMIYYIPNNRFNIGFGQTKIPGNRARLNSSSALQFVDRSIVNSTFQIDRDFGVFATYYPKALFNQFEVVGKAAITSGDGRNYSSQNNLGLAYTGRLELFPMGRFNGMGEVLEGDFVREKRAKLMLAGAVSYNDRTYNVDGQRGNTIFNNDTRDITSYFVDLIYKYQGFAFYVDYMGRMVSSPVIIDKTDSNNKQYSYKGQGLNVQTSYIFPSNWEIALRNSTLLPDSEIQDLVGYKTQNQTTLGVTKYLIGHSLKLQMDASYNYWDRLPLIGGKKSGYEFRFQVELGI